ncbi:chromatin associated protein KTI12 [Basidiobolus meristosporus CBS 931.73]|uniref:Chromatin associated protein KTI12 n=1 Tax=Basidiobolus meristosporus CBS 931.73 TaxID=1314790 RepID=A0A1Y1XVI5_9FUNG|nr:chromatin associated protein KTI12 [Basidiobolus meristosporus CBS 931.73]|eukprot:ORX89304.1 chromatin associated protein KTI12 [Basidiobolus meristosporus CBS 931.73]
MPLIIISGIPSSGKTTRALEIKRFLEEKCQQEKKNFRIHLINDETLHVSKEAYRAAAEEKKARGALISAIERSLTKDDIVIADAMNYIKGFRYQMYCVARAMGTPHCVVHCGVPIDKAKQWNSERSDGYDPQIFDELVTRYEEPEAKNKWDSPLFTVLWEDATVPAEDIWSAIVLKKAPPPNLSTVSKPVTETNYLYELDKVTQEIVNAVLEEQKNNLGSYAVSISNSSIKVQLPARSITLAELRRLRRQFININKMHTILDISRIAELFVQYLNTNFA